MSSTKYNGQIKKNRLIPTNKLHCNIISENIVQNLLDKPASKVAQMRMR